MKKILSSITLPLLLTTTSNLFANDEISLLENIKLKGEIRPRYEYANIYNNSTDKAQALTSRIKLNTSATLFGIEGLTTNIGLIGVYDFGWRSENGFYQQNDNKPIKNDTIADPNIAMLSNLELNYTIANTTLHAGRGQVNLDNARFIGTVGWRQLERSYDTLSITNKSIKNLSLLGAYVYSYEGVKSTNRTKTNSLLLHLQYSLMPELTISAYDYMLADLHDTIGVAVTGKINTTNATLHYRVEYAKQNDPTLDYYKADENIQADADYLNLDLNANINGIIAGANYEILSGAAVNSNKTSFKTPLGTNHKFNGWADVYLGGNDNTGLKDLNFKLGYTTKEFGKFLAIYHLFTADVAQNNKDDMGKEFDIMYTTKIPYIRNLQGLIAGAFFKGGNIGHTDDVTKFWLQLHYHFSTK